MSFIEIKRETLIALYNRLHVGDGQVYWYPSELAAFVDTNASLSMITKALISLGKEQLVETDIDPNDPNERDMYTLSDNGIVRAEQLTGNVDPAFGPRSKLENDDELIAVDVNQPKAALVDKALEELESGVRSSNEAFASSGAGREVAVAEISALRTLWRSGAIRLKTFKARAKSSLQWISEKAGSTIIAEMCKHAFKLIVGW